MPSRKPETESQTAKWRGWGLAACGLACVLLFQSFIDRPPKYENLLSSEAQVTRAPYLQRHLRGLDHVTAPLTTLSRIWSNKPRTDYFYPAFDLDGNRVWIATSFQSNAGSRELHDLAIGDKIRVLRN